MYVWLKSVPYNRMGEGETNEIYLTTARHRTLSIRDVRTSETVNTESYLALESVFESVSPVFHLYFCRERCCNWSKLRWKYCNGRFDVNGRSFDRSRESFRACRRCFHDPHRCVKRGPFSGSFHGMFALEVVDRTLPWTY